MVKSLRIVLVALLAFFFSAATLEIDVFDYENDFLDTYDTFVKVDSKITQRILHVEFEGVASSEIIQLINIDLDHVTITSPNEPRSSNFFYRPKLYLVKSSFLI